MKKLFAGISAVFLTATAALAVPWNMDNLQEFVFKTTVSLNGSCSGTVVDVEEQLVLTAYHCIMHKVSEKDGVLTVGESVIQMAAYKDKGLTVAYKADARLVAATPEQDLALLKIKGDYFPFDMEATISEDDIHLGEDVYAIGNPFGYGHYVSKGIVSSLHKLSVVPGMDSNTVETDAMIQPGSSGGGIYNTHGELIGVAHSCMQISGGFGSTPHCVGINDFIHVDEIRKLMDFYME